jgi:hypothetical protein
MESGPMPSDDALSEASCRASAVLGVVQAAVHLVGVVMSRWAPDAFGSSASCTGAFAKLA